MKIVVDIREIQAFILVFLRVGGILLFAPILGPKGTPWVLKVTLAVLTTLLIAPFAPRPPLLKGLEDFLARAASEAVIGMVLGFAIHLIFGAVQTAGQMIGYQMGFSMVNLLDPQGEYPIPIISHFVTMLAVLIFLDLNGHYWYITAIAKSYKVLGPEGGHLSQGLGRELLQQGGRLFVAATRIAAPLMVLIFLFYVAMALVARAMPQMNVFIVALPLQVGIGLVGLGLSLPFMAAFIKGLFGGLKGEIGLLLKAMGG